MNSKTVRAGFTMIELIVVIAIIGILSTLIVVSLDNAKVAGRDTRRLTDIIQLQVALKMYYNDVGRFPTTITGGQSIANGANNYLLRVPENPSPRRDGECLDTDYAYSVLDNGERYSLQFCLGDETDDLSAGPKTATVNGILDCEEGYVPVPGSATFDTNDFCAMKYEAKCVETSDPTVGLTSPTTVDGGYNDQSSSCSGGRQLASIPTGVPVTTVSQTTASAYCGAIGGHLMTNEEWMTIVRNAEQVAANWSGGTVGSGQLYGTNGSSITDIYDQNSSDVQADYGSKLSTGQFIWRLGNNFGEWVDNTCTGGTGIGRYYSNSSAFKWDEADFDDYERDASGPSNASWNNPENTGEFNGCSSDGNGFVRGGMTDINSTPGIFGIDLTNAPGAESSRISFRCVK